MLKDAGGGELLADITHTDHTIIHRSITAGVFDISVVDSRLSSQPTIMVIISIESSLPEL